MSSILVGMFESQTAAAKAHAELLSAGFSADAVSMTGGDTSSSSSGTTTTSGSTASTQGEGTVSRFFSNLFGGDDNDRSGHADTYREAFNRGSYGVTVSTASDDEMDQAEDILNKCGAVDIDEKAESWRKEGWTGGTTGLAATSMTGMTGTAGTTTTLQPGTTQTLQEVEEELVVGKRVVARGGVRIFSRMTETPVSETVRLREERASVQRTAVDRPATEADFAAFKEGTIEVRETAEEAVVTKSARVVGEVEIGKNVTEREEVVHDSVRSTKVDVEQVEGGMTSGGVRSTGLTSDTTGMTGTTDTTGLTGGMTGTTGSPNRDPLSGELGAHPVGTGIGAAAGGITAGAVAGSVAGPIGTAVGAAVGAVAGGLAGKGVAEAVDPTTGKKKDTL